MIEIITHRYAGFTRKEIWFWDGEEIPKGSYLVFCAARREPPGPMRFKEAYSTSVVDLSASEKDLQHAIHPTFRYDIRSAEKQGLRTEFIFNPSANDCKQVIAGYASFAAQKQLPRLNERLIKSIHQKAGLSFSHVYLGEELAATHIYVHDKRYASLTSSFHDIGFTNERVRSEGNKLLHWKDILVLKEHGFAEYDFGGLNPQKLPGVSKFKASFGGKTVQHFRAIQTPSPLFSSISVLKKIIRK